ncbi:hypothetical protein HAHE_06910 [Haloferula helveola]|uniref:LamG-like jellyroll fold domain-containing protein n=1 Tax=Haloferula helveola TaxID=490095 RepID=A0ABM7RG96_9BACT|nr:hypothetical protein HAHE_06910 [Haloferula helveola]
MNPSPRQIEQLFQDLEDGGISSQDHALLMRLLVDDPVVLRRYCRHMAFVGAMHQEAASRAELDGCPSRIAEPKPAGRLFANSLVAAAAILLITALVAAFITLRQEPPLVVTIEAPAGSAWSVSGGEDDVASNGVLHEGSTVEVATGLVSFTMDCGARMIVEGPATVSFPTLHNPVVESGSLWIETAPASEPMCVTAAGWEFRDIGTRFGVAIGTDGQPILTVTDGKVRASRVEGGASHLVTASDHASVFDADGDRLLVPAETDPFPALPRLLEKPSAYVSAVLRQSPVGYWNLDHIGSGAFLNRVRPDHPGQADLLVEAGSPGPQPFEGFDGISKSNACAVLPGNSEKSVIYDLDSPQGVALSQGAVSFWFRRYGNLNHREVLWFAGSEAEGLQEVQVYLMKDGTLHVLMEDGSRTVQLAAGRTVHDGRWHHVVASWGEGQLALYLDGDLAASERGVRMREAEPFRGINVRAGKVGLNAKHRGEGGAEWKTSDAFTGMLDEIALWDRSLTAGEVRDQYDAASANGR